MASNTNQRLHPNGRGWIVDEQRQHHHHPHHAQQQAQRHARQTSDVNSVCSTNAFQTNLCQNSDPSTADAGGLCSRSVKPADKPPAPSASSSTTRCQCCPYGFHIDTDFVRYCDALLAALNAQRTTKSSSYLSQRTILRTAGSKDGFVNDHSFEDGNSCETSHRWRAQCRRKFNLGRTNPEMLNTLPPALCSATHASFETARPRLVSPRPAHSSSSHSALQFISNVPTQSVLQKNQIERQADHEGDDDDDDSSTKNFLKYCQSFNDAEDDETDFDRRRKAIVNNGDCRVNCGVNYFDNGDDADAPRQQLPKVIGYDEYSSASSLSPITSAFEVKTIAATKNSARHYLAQDKPSAETIFLESSETLSESGASCASSISRSVLEQIRQHLAFSLQRVETLEQQVSNIPALRQQIDMLQAEKSQLETRLKKNADRCEREASDAVQKLDTHVQTGDSSLPPKFMSESTDTQDLFDSAFTEISVQTDNFGCAKADMIDSLDNSRDSSFFKSTLGSLTDASSRSNSTSSILRLCHDCSRDGAASNNSAAESGNVSAVTSRMAQSVTSTDDEHQCRGESVSRVSVGTESVRSIQTGLIKADSGISVERQSRTIDPSCEQSLVNDSITKPTDSGSATMMNQSLQSCSSSNSEELSSSSDGETNNKAKRMTKKKAAKAPLDIKKVRPSTEVRIALAILNENLLDLQKADRSVFNKNLAYIKRAWFQVSATKDSDSRIVELYLDCFEEFSQKLLEFVVNLSDTNGNTAMHYAISFANFDIVSVLLNSKVCDVNLFNKAGYSATMLAALCDLEGDQHTDNAHDDNVCKAVVQQLFRRANLNLKAKQNGQTALMLASSHGRAEVCRLLLDSGADVNLQDNDGSTALMCAAEHGHSEVVSLLLSNFECDPHLEDNEGMCALKIALNSGHNECAIRLYIGSRISESNCSFHSSSSSLRNPAVSATIVTPSQPLLSSSSSSSSSSSPNGQRRQQPRYVPEPAVSFPYDCIASFSRSLQHLSVATPKATAASRRTPGSGANKSPNYAKAGNHTLLSPPLSAVRP